MMLPESGLTKKSNSPAPDDGIHLPWGWQSEVALVNGCMASEGQDDCGEGLDDEPMTGRSWLWPWGGVELVGELLMDLNENC